MFTNHFDSNTQTLNLVFAGHIDTIACQAMDAPVNALITDQLAQYGGQEGVLKVAFDMNEVTFIASSFIRLCVYYAKRLPKNNFRLVNCNPFVKKTFMIAGLEALVRD